MSDNDLGPLLSAHRCRSGWSARRRHRRLDDDGSSQRKTAMPRCDQDHGVEQARRRIRRLLLAVLPRTEAGAPRAPRRRVARRAGMASGRFGASLTGDTELARRVASATRAGAHRSRPTSCRFAHIVAFHPYLSGTAHKLAYVWMVPTHGRSAKRPLRTTVANGRFR